MAGRYARETTVPVERSRAEIEETVRRYEATKFTSGWDEDHNSAMVMFHIRGFYIRFTIPMPDPNDRSITHVTRRGQLCKRTDRQRADEYEQQTRQRWRALLLAIKGKLEAVECKISTIEAEFLAHIVMPDDRLVGEWLAQEALPSIIAGRMPQLGYTPQPGRGDVIDVEATPAEGGRG
jgi:hypothetical protein